MYGRWLSFALSLLLLGPLFAGDLRKLLPSDGEAEDGFGQRLDVSGPLAVIVALDEPAYGGTASVYVFDITTGQRISKPMSDVDVDALATKVAIEGTTVVLTQRIDAAVHVFDALSGDRLRVLTPDDPSNFSFFGVSVDMSGSRVAVGATRDFVSGTDSGSVYVFDAGSGAQLAELVPGDAEDDDEFGTSVSLDGDLLLAGSLADDDAGAAYLFDLNTLTERRKYAPPSVKEGDHFGAALALAGGVAAIGVPLDFPLNKGSAFSLDVASGKPLGKLHPSDGEPWDRFGTTIDTDGLRVFVGSPFHADERGAVYVYDAATGVELAKLQPGGAAPGDRFGESLALSELGLVIGAPGDDEQGTDAGAAYVLPLGRVGTSFCGPSQANSTGLPGEIAASGTDRVDCNLLSLEASSLPPRHFALFLVSRTQGFAQPPGSQGFLCLGGAIGAYAEQVRSTGAGGTASIHLDLAATPTPVGPVAIQPGETWSFQCWYRDQNPGPTSNLTDGVVVTFR